MRLQQPNKLTAARQTAEVAHSGAGNRSLKSLLHFLALIRGSAIGSTPAFGAGYPGSSPGPGAIPPFQSAHRYNFCTERNSRWVFQSLKVNAWMDRNTVLWVGDSQAVTAEPKNRGQSISSLRRPGTRQVLSSGAGRSSGCSKNGLRLLHQAERACLSAFRSAEKQDFELTLGQRHSYHSNPKLKGHTALHPQNPNKRAIY